MTDFDTFKKNLNALMETDCGSVERVFQDYYYEQASQEGEWMMDDDRFNDGYDGIEMEPSDVYDDFAHCTGYSASYHGAYGVLHTYGEQLGCTDPNDEDYQVEVIKVVGYEY